MANSADLDQLASLEAQLIWIYTVCEDRVYPGSAGPGLTCHFIRLHSAVGSVSDSRSRGHKFKSKLFWGDSP